MLKVLMMKLYPARRYSCRNIANNRVQKRVPKSYLKRHKSRVKSTANMWMILSFVGAVDRVHVPMRGAFATLLMASIFDYWRNI